MVLYYISNVSSQSRNSGILTLHHHLKWLINLNYTTNQVCSKTDLRIETETSSSALLKKSPQSLVKYASISYFLFSRLEYLASSTTINWRLINTNLQ